MKQNVEEVLKQVSFEPYKRCGCGMTFETRDQFDTLPDAKTYTDSTGALMQQRRCSLCHSHILVELIPSMNAADMRRAMHVINDMRENFNDRYTALELFQLVTMLWRCGWDIYPDQWTNEQLTRVLTEGRVPTFVQYPTHVHALEVSDCLCSRLTHLQIKQP